MLLNPFEALSWSNRMELWTAPKELQDKYIPQDYQEQFHKEVLPYGMVAVSGGIGAAKTLTTVMHYAPEALAALERRRQGFAAMDGATGRIAIVGPSYGRPVQVAFNYLRRILEANNLIEGDVSTSANRAWTMRTITGVHITTVSAADPYAFASQPFTKVHLCEAMQMPRAILDMAMERVARWPGPHRGKVFLDGTFEPNANMWFPDVCRAWEIPNREGATFRSFPSWLNKYNFPGGFDDPKIQEALLYYKERGDEEEFWVRLGGKIRKNVGALWADYLRARVHVGAHEDEPAFDPDLPCDFTFDPATHRYAGLFLQWQGRTLNVFDELVMEKASFPQYRAAWLKLPYVQNIDPKRGSIVTTDNAAKITHQGTTPTTALWSAPVEAGGCGVYPLSKWLGLEDGVRLLQNALAGDYFDIRISPRCVELLRDLRTEKRNEHGQLSAAVNKGADDCRKALSYYLNIKVGAAGLQPPLPAVTRARGTGRSRTI